jgi:hypothetical protein
VLGRPAWTSGWLGYVRAWEGSGPLTAWVERRGVRELLPLAPAAAVGGPFVPPAATAAASPAAVP